MTQYLRAHNRKVAVVKAAAYRSRKFERPTDMQGRLLRTSEYYGSHTFSYDLMAERLAPDDVAKLREFATSNEPLTLELADKVAIAAKEWAISMGATHYCHWFQPQTGATAEKHDSFFSFDEHSRAMEKFTGSQLVQSEPDASSFPSGGRRTTFEARGYTAWDASSPMFLMTTDNGRTLCIPSLYVSYHGEALDQKTPLLRSIACLSKAATESLRLLGVPVNYVNVTAGPEQEYFVVDEALRSLRPDLVLSGRTLQGRTPPKGQQMEDHYFGTINPHVLNFMMECEHELYQLGVPCKTRHNEVAPSQCEMAPIFENANVAADHNQLVMEVIRSVARRHRLVALFHEKPYAGLNGSGKHLNWSLSTNTGINLLEPGERPQDNLRFLFFLMATVKAVHEHGALMRAAIASAGNDFRLGANEAPPAIMSVFLGETLTEVLDRMGSDSEPEKRDTYINLDLARVPVISRDNTDRNRTSPFAFTGNKFEFRALGSSTSVSQALTFLNTAVAQALIEMNGRLNKVTNGKTPNESQIFGVVHEVVNETKAVRFEGNNYSEKWHQEAEKRGLANLRTTPEALSVLKDQKTKTLFSNLGVMKPSELEGRYNIQLEQYSKIRLIELETVRDLIVTQVLPAADSQLLKLADTIKATDRVLEQKPKVLVNDYKTLLEHTVKLRECMTEVRKLTEKSQGHEEDEKVAKSLANEGIALLEKANTLANEIEGLVDDELWALPKYHELMFLQ